MNNNPKDDDDSFDVLNKRRKTYWDISGEIKDLTSLLTKLVDTYVDKPCGCAFGDTDFKNDLLDLRMKGFDLRKSFDNDLAEGFLTLEMACDNYEIKYRKYVMELHAVLDSKFEDSKCKECRSLVLFILRMAK